MSTLAIVGLVALVVLAVLMSFKVVRRTITVVGLLATVLLTLLFIDGKVTIGEVGDTVFKWSRKAATAIDSATAPGEGEKGEGTRLAKKLDEVADSVRSTQQFSTEVKADVSTLSDKNAKLADRLAALDRLVKKGIIDGEDQDAKELSEARKKLKE
jgi:ABC-type multidrug transport system fused ATPase/permease subunit